MASDTKGLRLEAIIDGRLSVEASARCFWWEGKWYSKIDFSRLTDKIETALREFGFKKGQRIIVMMANCPAFPALSLAAWRIGGAVVPLNVKSGTASLVRTLELIEPYAVILSETGYGDIAPVLLEHGFGCLACGPMGDFSDLDSSRAMFRESSILTPDIAVLFVTSGTTGLPKAVPLSHGNIYDNCVGMWDIVIPLEKGDVFLNVMPNFHTIGYTIGNILPLVMDTAQAIVPAFMPPKNCVRAISEAKVNIMFVVPAVAAYLLTAVERGEAPKDLFSHFKIIITGGDKLSDHLHDMALRIAGIDLVEGYGLTETSPAIAINRDYATHRRGTVGPFLKSYEWRLKTEKGEDAPGNEGVLWVRGPSVAERYFRAPEATAERFIDGWFNTGDYVKVEDGYVTILDRVTDIIIVGGFNVYPQEVELILNGHPAVRTAIVVGITAKLSGQIPKAFVTKEPGVRVTERELINYCKKHMAHYKVPRKVEFIDEFPISPTGKILRRTLRERERENLGSK
ncbi:MAG: AMP-binding protein [Synergistaceae bacterium]|jgi:long-chain acyl-CoA synthetase|nr:AMP-binding protein [Synergistaceae bacterium]